MALIDLDEYVIPLNHSKISSFLISNGQPDIEGFVIKHCFVSFDFDDLTDATEKRMEKKV